MYVNRFGSMCHISPLFMYNCMGEFRKIICHRTVFAYTTENQLTYFFTSVDEDNTIKRYFHDFVYNKPLLNSHATRQ